MKPAGMKLCKDCGRLRPLSAFYRRGDAHGAYCKIHQRARVEASRNPETVRRWRERHRERWLAQNRAAVRAYRQRKRQASYYLSEHG